MTVNQSPYWSSMSRHYERGSSRDQINSDMILQHNQHDDSIRHFYQEPISPFQQPRSNAINSSFYDDTTQTRSWLKNKSHTLRSNRKAVLAVVKRNGRELQFATPNIQDDLQVALAAVSQNGMALIDVSKGKQHNKDVVLTAVQQNGMALEYAGGPLRNNKGIVLAAVNQNGLALKFASKKLRRDMDVVLTAIKENGMANQFILGSLRKDKTILAAAVSQTMRGSRNNSASMAFYV